LRIKKWIQSLNTIKKKCFIVIYDEMESNLAQINVIEYANEHKRTAHVYESTAHIYTCYLKSQTVKP
jgi:hypothetical protein